MVSPTYLNELAHLYSPLPTSIYTTQPSLRDYSPLCVPLSVVYPSSHPLILLPARTHSPTRSPSPSASALHVGRRAVRHLAVTPTTGQPYPSECRWERRGLTWQVASTLQHHYRSRRKLPRPRTEEGMVGNVRLVGFVAMSVALPASLWRSLSACEHMHGQMRVCKWHSRARTCSCTITHQQASLPRRGSCVHTNTHIAAVKRLLPAYDC